ncbi:MAG TPA: glucosamine-6-phosphate deaminase [Verrucomicrobiae bacterium]|nr:glucosamine-6-phosphate deaminase [Verrucomicrobiae bacterium]
MEIIIESTVADAQQEAARILRRQIRRKPDSVLGLATGATPIGVYAILCEMHQRGELDFGQVRTFNLDEYVGLSPDHPCSYRAFMQQHLFGKVNLPPENIRFPNGLATDVPAHCAEYEEAIRQAGGIDLQLLGIGRDGHIGFNEPSSSLASRTRIKTLTPQTLKDNASCFGNPEQVPHHVITMGVGTIMDARQCLLLATGDRKADVVAGMVEGPITADLPASILQMHPACTLVVDEPAATRLKRAEYYRWVYANKPKWQQG